MRIAVVVSVKDEVDLIDRSLRHLGHIGADEIVVCDKGSTDGTRQRLDDYRTQSGFGLVEISDRETHDVWAAEILAVVRASSVDWVTFIDADEFIVPRSGRLHDTRAFGYADVVSVDRFNVPLVADRPAMPDHIVPEHFPELYLVAEPIVDYWSDDAQAHSTSWMYARVAPRVFARPQQIERLGMGGHDVSPSDPSKIVRTAADDVLVAHVPVTTWPRFNRKVENIREFLAVHDESFGTTRARHWRRWAAAAETGALQAEFSSLSFTAETFAEMRKRGVVCSADEVFSKRAAWEQA